MEYDTSGINVIEADAFNAEAFKSVKSLVFTKMDLRWLTKGLFNGLESLEVLKIKDASQMQSIYLGILDGVNETLKEFTIESNSSYEWHHDNIEIKQVRVWESFSDPLLQYYGSEELKQMDTTDSVVNITDSDANTTDSVANTIDSVVTTTESVVTTTDPLKWYHDRQKFKPVRAYQSVEAPKPLEIDVFTGSQSSLVLEYMKVRYYLDTLTSKSFVALKNIKHLDLSNCGIESILQGTFDPVISTIKVLRLMNNPFKQLPVGMFDLIPPSFDTYIFMGDDVDECECEYLPINFIVKVDCSQPSLAYKTQMCHSFLPVKQTTISLTTTTSEPTIASESFTTDNATILSTLKRATINLINTSKTIIVSESSTINGATVLPYTELTLNEAIINSITTPKPTIISSLSTVEDTTVPSIQTKASVGEPDESSMLPTMETSEKQTTEAQAYFQPSSKYIYLIIVGVAVVLSLVSFIVWFKVCKQKKFSFVSQDDQFEI